MHGLPYINASNFAQANAEAKRIIESGEAAVAAAEAKEKFDKDVAEATARVTQ